MKMMTPAKQKEFISKKYNIFYPAPEVTKAEREVSMKSNLKYDIVYGYCIYSGISRQLDFEIKYGTNDNRKELKYIVDRYCDEEMVSGKYLIEKYNEYVASLKAKKII